MLRMVAMDFDFTLVDYPPHGAYAICPELIDTLERMASVGIQAGVVSGRAYDQLQETLWSVGARRGGRFPSFLICQDTYVYQSDGLGGFAPDEAHNQAARQAIMASMQSLLPVLHQCMDALQRAGVEPREWKIIGTGGAEWVAKDPDQAQQGLQALQAFTPQIDVNRNHHLINLVPKGHGKGKALQRFAHQLGIAPASVVAIGDSLNDLSMLDGRFGFRSGAVANADPAVKAAVAQSDGHVADRRASFGVLEILQRYEEEYV